MERKSYDIVKQCRFVNTVQTAVAVTSFTAGAVASSFTAGAVASSFTAGAVTIFMYARPSNKALSPDFNALLYFASLTATLWSVWGTGSGSLTDPKC